MANLFVPEGKTYLVTGGASGIGAQYVEAALREGAKAVAILDLQVEKGKELVDRLSNAYPNKVIFIKCDVGNEIEVTETFNEVLKQFKQVDVVINNAGVMVDSPTSWRKASDVNWQGLVSFTLKGVKHMRKDEGGGGGTIINVSSIVALCTFRFLPVYSGSKSAVLHFSRCLASGAFHEQTGVRILTICFGPTDTPLRHGLEARAWDECSAKELMALVSNFQKVESAVAAFLKMFREGANGSIWLSIDDKPGKDVTSSIDAGFKEFEKMYMALALSIFSDGLDFMKLDTCTYDFYHFLKPNH